MGDVMEALGVSRQRIVRVHPSGETPPHTHISRENLYRD